MDASILTLLVFVPVAGAVGLLFVPRAQAERIKWIAAGVAGLQLLLAIWLWVAFEPASAA